MNRTASIVAVGGLLTAAICLPVAAVLQRNAAQPAWWWDFARTDWFQDGPDVDGRSLVARDFNWDGSDRAELDGSGELHFHPAPTWHLTVRGLARTLDRLRISNGHIGLKGSGFFHSDNPGRFEVQLSGPALREIGVNGSGSITLDELSQEALGVRIRGSGTAVAHGGVQSLHLEISGSGSARLEALTAKEASVHISGSGDADIAPDRLGGRVDLWLRRCPTTHLAPRISTLTCRGPAT